MFNRLFRTSNDFSLFILRVTLGIVFIPHGFQKIFGLFGGAGFNGTIQMFNDNFGIHPALTVLVMTAEFLGAFFLVIGFLTRLSAFGIVCVMSGAVYLVHWKNGFFMNWLGSQSGEGFEFHLLAVAIGLALMIRGGGWRSIDRSIALSQNQE